MKKRILTLMLLLITATFAAEANPVDMRSTREVAMKFVNANTRTPLRGMDELQLAITYNISCGDAAFHVFNTPNGFVIVSADDCASPILGYSDEGRQFDINNIPIQLLDILNEYKEQIQYAVEHNLHPDEATVQQWLQVRATGRLCENRDRTQIGPLLTTTWDQGQYYNALCPEDANGPDGHVWTGCVATAMAQIINYWEYPTHGRGTHSYESNYGTLSVNYNSVMYDYSNMPDTLSSECTDEEINAVAKLISDCGVAVNMGYSAGESSAYDQEARAALINFYKYSPNLSYAEKEFFSTEEWNTMLQTELNANRVLYYSGYGTGGHAFVCDGYNSDGYYHFNFGWNGAGNDWYLLDVINPLGMDFNSSQAAILGIVPDANGNVILGQMQGNSTFTVDEPLEFYHIMGHNLYEGHNYTNPCNNTVTFISTDPTNQMVVDIMEFEDQSVEIFADAGVGRMLCGGCENDLSPVASSNYVISLSYSGILYYAGFNLLISQNSGCRMVSNIITSIELQTVHLSWTENGSSTQWQIEYGEEGFSLGEGTLITVNMTTIDITFPQKLTKYDIYIRSVCGEEEYGIWGQKTIMTDAPYWQDVVVTQPESYEIMDNCALISCAEDFVWYLKSYGGNARLVSDIDLSGYKWKPQMYYHCTLDGNGHKITNLFVVEKNNTTALFSRLSGTVNDLGIEDSHIIGKSVTAGLCGTLVGNAFTTGKIYNCYITNSSVYGEDGVGGLVAQNYGIIENCYANVSIDGNRGAGLLTGSSSGTIVNCYAAGSVRLRSYCYYAGIAAFANNGLINKCYSIDLPMGVIGYIDAAEISDTSSFYRNNTYWTLRTPISFDGFSEDNLLDALNKEVLQMNDSTMKEWIADSGISNTGLPMFGDYFIVQCPNVTNLTVQNAKENSVSCVVVDWDETGNAESWDIRCWPVNTPYESATITTVFSKPVTLYELPLNQEYTISVRSVCDNENHSGWTSKREMIDLPFWTDVVTEQPEGYYEDSDGNVIISSAEGLAWLSNLVNGFNGNESRDFSGKTISLTTDIDLEGYRWFPIGRDWRYDDNMFSGTFLGNGHSISDLYVNSSGPCLGLFGFVGYGAAFKDIYLTNGNITSYYGEKKYIGGLIGYGQEISEITNCHSGVNVSGMEAVGSLCGYVRDQEGESLIASNCSASGLVYGRQSCGGLFGEVRGVFVRNCYATGDVLLNESGSNAWYRGGLIGNFMSNSSVRNCYSTGNVEMGGGRVIGCLYSNSTTHYVYGLKNSDLPLIGPSYDEVADTSSFVNLNDQQALLTPVIVNNHTYDNLLDVLNAWVSMTNDQSLKTWTVDTNNVNGGYPVFGDNYEPSCYNPTNVCLSNATVAGETIIRTEVMWEQEGNPSSWDVLYVGAQQSLDQGIIISVNSNPCELTNLPVGELLDIYVRARNNDEDISGWSMPVRYIPDKLHWTEVVTSQPEGYVIVNNEDVYIYSSEGLAWLSSVMNGLNGNNQAFYPHRIFLMSDIDLSSYRWTPIAMGNAPIRDFVFDGNGHSITGLYCNEYESKQGLFGWTNQCTIKNLVVIGSLVRGLTNNGTIAGASNWTQLINCTVNGEVYGVMASGGVIGNCVDHVEINNVAFIGMADTRTEITLPECYNGFIGGIAGTTNGLYMENTYVAAEIPTSAFSGILAGSGSGVYSNLYALDYPTELGFTCENLEVNSTFYSGSGTAWTLSNPQYIGGSFRSDLLDALNAWVDENNTESQYRHWVADTAMVNGGFPILEEASMVYLITAISNPADGGTVAGAGIYSHGETASLTTTANEGYTFANWTNNDSVVSTNPTYSFTVTEASDYTANFELNTYAITATANPTEGGEVTGAGTYNHFATCTLAATPNTGYHFLNWTKDGEVVSTTATYAFEVTGPAGYVANFEQNSYAITATANPAEGGTVTGDGTYNHFATCTLVATPNTGYIFTTWTKDGTVVSTNATYSFTVTEAASFVANFTLNSYNITVTANPTEGGTVTGAGSYSHGAMATLTATANEGYTFINWTRDGEEVSTEATYNFEVTEALAFVANFELNTYAISVTASPEVGGTVDGAGTYDHGAMAILTATANEGYTFINWTRDGEEVSTEATYSFTVTEASDYTANFELNTYAITATASPEVGGTVDGAGTYDYGATATLTATATEGYTFINWTRDGEEISTEATYSFTVTEASDYTANFELNTYAITATASPEVGGAVDGAGTYSHGATATLTATAATGYTFTIWTKDGEIVSNNATYIFTVTEEASFVANFEESSVTQTSEFANGWNWWSTYVEADDLMAQLKAGLGADGKQIKSQTKFTMNYGTTWMGQLNSIENDQTYMIQALAPCVVEVTGSSVNPADYPITLNTGWKWIGFPSAEPLTVTEALAGITPTAGDQIKAQSSFSTYYNNLGWMGTLKNLTPGKGYMFKLNGASQTLVFPSASRATVVEENITADGNHWVPDVYAYPSNMTVVAVVELDDVVLASDNFELAAFANGEVRGSTKLMYVEGLNRWMAFLTIAGDEVAELYFCLYDTETGMMETQDFASLQYETDAIVGSPDEPFVARFRGTTGMDEWTSQIFPNPVERGQSIRLSLPYEGKVHVEIVNELGVETRRARSVQSPASIEAPSAPGVYTLRITVEGRGTCYRKLVVE